VLFTAMLITGTGGSLKGKAGAELAGDCPGHDTSTPCGETGDCSNLTISTYSEGPYENEFSKTWNAERIIDGKGAIEKNKCNSPCTVEGPKPKTGVCNLKHEKKNNK
jgi:hypothetical protein